MDKCNEIKVAIGEAIAGFGSQQELTDRVAGSISQYVEFVTHIRECDSISEVDEIVNERPFCKKINDRVQLFLAMRNRGVCELSRLSTVAAVDNPVLKMISTSAVTASLSGAHVPADGMAEEVLASVAAQHLLGVEMWIDPEYWSSNFIALIPERTARIKH